KHGVGRGTAQRDTEAMQNVESEFEIVCALGNGCIFEKRAQLGCERKTESGSLLRTKADAEAGFLVGLLDDIEQRRRGRNGSIIFGFHGCGFGGVERKGEAVLPCGSLESCDLLIG